MNHSHEPPLSSSQSLHDLIKSFLKAYDTRSEEEHEQQLSFLSEIPYFQRFLNSPCQRKEFLQGVLKHVKYSYYPKGASIYETGEYGEFQVIISGEAFVYKFKKESELKADAKNENKKKATRLYSKFLEENNYERLHKRSSHAYSRASLSRALISLAQGYMSNRQNLGIEYAGKKCEALGVIINEVLYNGNDIVSHENNEKDLLLEEKLLLLNTKEGNYVRDGQILYTKTKVLRDRDVLGNTALSLEVPFENPVIASEDTHVLVVSKKKVQALFGKKVFREKQEFMKSVFGDLDAESLLHLCIHSEERACSAKEILYNYGDQPDGSIYLVKSGKVQLVRSDKEKMKENYKNAESLGIALDLVRSPLKKLQMSSGVQVTVVEQSGIFGGEGSKGAKITDHMAITAAPLTFLYVLKKDVYLEIFEKHLPQISNSIKNLLSKNINTELATKAKETTTVRRPESSTSPVKNIRLTTTRLMGELEAQYRHLDSERPELIKETKLTPVLYQEDRSSRLMGNKVEITVCDVSQKPHLIDHPSPLVPKSTMKLQNTSSSSVKRQRSVEAIQSVKSSLFIRNQTNHSSRTIKRNKEENRSLRTSRCGGIVRAESNITPVLDMMISPRSGFSRTQSLRSTVIDPKNPYDFKLKMSIDAGADIYTLSGLQTDRSSTSRYNSIISPNRILGTPHVRLTADAPAEQQQQRILTAGGNQMLKRVTALMAKKKNTDRETPVPSMNSIGISLAKLNSEENLITPRSCLPKTATSYKTINSSENLEIKTVRSTSILGSLARLNAEEDSEVLRNQPSKTPISSILIPSLGNLEGVGKALGPWENIEGEPAAAGGDQDGGGLSSRRKRVLIKKKELGIKMMISPKEKNPGPGYFTSRPKRMSEVLY